MSQACSLFYPALNRCYRISVGHNEYKRLSKEMPGYPAFAFLSRQERGKGRKPEKEQIICHQGSSAKIKMTHSVPKYMSSFVLILYGQNRLSDILRIQTWRKRWLELPKCRSLSSESPERGGIISNERERAYWLGRGWRLERTVAQKQRLVGTDDDFLVQACRASRRDRGVRVCCYGQTS